jgi:hypothetical protein
VKPACGNVFLTSLRLDKYRWRAGYDAVKQGGSAS